MLAADDLLPRAPDGGYGWVVVLCAFTCNLVYGGCDYSFGILLPHIQRRYDAGSAASALAGSLCTSTFYLMGPPVAAAVNRYGSRRVAVVGALVTGAAWAAAAFAPNLPLFILLYSFIGG